MPTVCCDNVLPVELRRQQRVGCEGANREVTRVGACDRDDRHQLQSLWACASHIMISFSRQEGLMLEVADQQHDHAQIPATPHETLGIEHPKRK